MLKTIELNLQKLNKFKIVDFAYTENLIPEHYDFYENWIDKKFNGPLGYLEGNNQLKRKSLKQVFEKCQSALVFLFSHLEMKKYLDEKKYKKVMASFVLGYDGLDYHDFIKESLDLIVKENFKEIKTMICVDTMPVLERDLAHRAGLGFIGKNSMLIHPEFGSYVMIGTILLDQVLSYPKRPVLKSKCGDCDQCLKACPTGAITEAFLVDASQCISTFTIEQMKKVLPPKGYVNQKYFFGCDSCQDCCPFNLLALSKITKDVSGIKENCIEENFFKEDLFSVKTSLEKLSNNAYKKKFNKTSLERTGRVGMLKNIEGLED